MLLTVKEFAARTGETVCNIRHWCQRGQIAATHEFVALKNSSLYRREWRIDSALLIGWKRPTKHTPGPVKGTPAPKKRPPGEPPPSRANQSATAKRTEEATRAFMENMTE